MRNLLKLLLFIGRHTGGGRATRLALVTVIAAGLLSGAASSGFIALINAALHGSLSSRFLLSLFVLCCVLLPALRFTSTVLLTHLTQQAQFELRLALSRRILAAPLLDLERIGPARLLGVVTEDIGAITGALSNLPLVLLHLTVVIGCLLYLAWLSPTLLLLVLAFMVVGVTTYRFPLWQAQRRFRRVREAWDSLCQQMRGLTDGSKELKVHRQRREAFIDQLVAPAARSLWHHTVRGTALVAAANSWGQVLFFVLIGLLLFGRQAGGGLQNEVLTGYSLAILYMITPLDAILNLLPTFGRAAVAADNVDSLGLHLDGAVEAPQFATAGPRPRFQRRLELVAVTHTFRTEAGEEEFVLGPLDLAFAPRQVVFFVGGNGSGKTTLAKVLLGLYRPRSGEIRLDGRVIDDEGLDAYRQLFAAVFSDFYLFDRLLGLDSPDLDARAGEALVQLQLDRKVTVRDGQFSTLDLSQGQRKRLALLAALLDDRPIYLFDEWAADQDPTFKRLFYRELLPALQAAGKTLFVISHDDGYYDAADRIVKLDYGRVVFDGAAADYLSEYAERARRATSVAAATSLFPLGCHGNQLRVSSDHHRRWEDMSETLSSGVGEARARDVAPPAGRRRLRRVRRASFVSAAVLAAGAGAGTLWLSSELQESLPQLDETRALPGLTAPVAVERDALGVPTIRAARRVDAARALGFVHAQDRFFQMDLQRRAAAGELADLLGPALLETDRANRVHRFRHLAHRNLAAAPPEQRALISAYAAGVNAGLAALAAYPFEYGLLRVDPAPWQPEDTLLTIFAMFFDLHDENGSRESSLGLMYDLLPEPLVRFLAPAGTEWDAPLLGQPVAAAAVPGPEVFDLRRPPALPQAAWRLTPETWLPAEDEFAAAGSNSFALAKHTADGRALLANDMHLGIRVPNTWYRTALVWSDSSGGEHRVVGVTLPGTPAVVVGSNGHVAWGFSNSYGDWNDLVVLELDRVDPNRYRTPAGMRRFRRTTEVLRVKGRPVEQVEVRDTVWGPVINTDHRGRPRALAWTAHQPAAADLGILGLETARTVEEAFAVAHRSGMPPQNLVIVDRTGRIGWTIMGRVPRRLGFDGRIPTSWADGTGRWDGWLAPEEVPRVIDPPSGRIWTANARVVDGEMLARLGDGGYYLGARARQIRDDLFALDRATERDLLAVQLDDRALFLERWRRLVLEILTPQALAGSPRRREFRELVERSWTGRASVDSVGYRLVRTFRGMLLQQVFAALTGLCAQADERFNGGITHQAEAPLWQLVTERPPHLLDPRFRTWEEQLLAAVDASIDYFGGYRGALSERTWGERNTTQIRHPLSSAIPLLGSRLAMAPRQLPGDDDMPRVQGPDMGASQRLVVSPGHEQDGLFHMPVGQSGHPLSPYYREGHRAWEEGEATAFLPGRTQHLLRLVPASR